MQGKIDADYDTYSGSYYRFASHDMENIINHKISKYQLKFCYRSSRKVDYFLKYYCSYTKIDNVFI